MFGSSPISHRPALPFSPLVRSPKHHRQKSLVCPFHLVFPSSSSSSRIDLGIRIRFSLFFLVVGRPSLAGRAWESCLGAAKRQGTAVCELETGRFAAKHDWGSSTCWRRPHRASGPPSRLRPSRCARRSPPRSSDVVEKSSTGFLAARSSYQHENDPHLSPGDRSRGRGSRMRVAQDVDPMLSVQFSVDFH
jgi:hypothetical protein